MAKDILEQLVLFNTEAVKDSVLNLVGMYIDGVDTVSAPANTAVDFGLSDSDEVCSLKGRIRGLKCSQ